MGLDVYLYKCPDRKLADEAEKKHEDFSELVWAKHERYEDFTEEEKTEARRLVDEFNATVGIVDYQHGSRQKVELPSAKYPDHYFKIGYFRSSYNGSGINSVMRRIGLPDLYAMFETNGEDTDGVHDWEACRARAVEAIEKYSAYIQSPLGKIDIMDVDSFGIRNMPEDENGALKIFEEQFHRWTGEFDNEAYSNGGGTYFPGGTKIYAVIPGKSKYGRNQIFVAFESSGREWYVHALEIVLETIDYILAQPDKEQYYLAWSG